MVRCLMVMVGITAFLATVPAGAQQAVMSQLYGDGVHAYFAGDYRLAYERLSAAIDAGTPDPRAYYFRGLAYRMLGRPQEAAADFQRGARLEIQMGSGRFNVAQALERVQGEPRMQLEAYRTAARKTALKAANQMRHSRYEALKQEEQRVLLLQVEAAKMPPEIIATPAALEEKPEAPKIADSAVETGTPATPAKAGPENKTAEADDNPFVQKPVAAAPAPQTPENTAEKPKEKSKLFGALRGAVGKALTGGVKPPAGMPMPFGPGNGAVPPAAQPPAGSNPFADTPAPPAKDKPAAEPPAGENPFADTPAPPAKDKPAGENPFGDQPAAEKKAPEEKPASESEQKNPFE